MNKLWFINVYNDVGYLFESLSMSNQGEVLVNRGTVIIALDGESLTYFHVNIELIKNCDRSKCNPLMVEVFT